MAKEKALAKNDGGKTMRKEISEFAEKMEEVTAKHDGKKGDSWKTCEPIFLINKLMEETEEYIMSKNREELIDIANICWMLYYNKFYNTDSVDFIKRREAFYEATAHSYKKGKEDGLREKHETEKR